jgi:hypothetical protein
MGHGSWKMVAFAVCGFGFLVDDSVHNQNIAENYAINYDP